ncbi:MAG: PD-(D/E)XK nuclease-like domain-containing protein [Ruminococcus sp.]|nr:PD-(D/E)XK nuclease-like domain-containing protein [Ruminococcus sp.]
MTNAEYHAHSAISKSDLDLIHRSPAHWIYKKNNPNKQTPEMLFGSAVHKMVLEPETFFDEFVVAPEVDKRTKSGKEEWNSFLEESKGKTVITNDILIKSKDIAESISHHVSARQLLTGGCAETSHFWTDERTGMQCKCRPDYLRSGFCVDLKTTQNASEESFQKSAYKYRYYLQAYWYLHGLKQCGIDYADYFTLIAVEKEPPYGIATYYVDEDMLQLGKIEADEDLDRICECMKNNYYSGYPEQLQCLGLPSWAKKKLI